MCNVTILCSDGPHHLYLVGEVLKAFGTVRVIVEPGHMQTARHLRNKAYRAFLWSTYHQWRRRFFGYDRYRKNYFQRDEAPCTWESLQHMSNVNVLMTTWINDPVVSEELRRSTSDVYIVMGTKKISIEVLNEIPPNRIINIHGGHLPDYKGNHCFFFALKNGDFDKLSTTIHHVSTGLDTGDIMMHYSVQYQDGDNSESLYSRAEKMAIDELIARLKVNANLSTWESIQQKDIGVLYRMQDRGPLTELSHLFATRKRRLRLARSRT